MIQLLVDSVTEQDQEGPNKVNTTECTLYYTYTQELQVQTTGRTKLGLSQDNHRTNSKYLD